MSLSTTPDAASQTAATGATVAADELPKKDAKKRALKPGVHAAIWIVIGYLTALVIIAAWPLALLISNGGNGSLTGPGY